MEQKKIKLLIVFLHYHTGGATTSLLNFLQELDYGRYDVDLLFYEYAGQADGKIPKEVHVLPQAKVHRKFSLRNVLSKALSLSYMGAKLHAEFVKRVLGREKKSIQIMSKQGCRYSRRLDKEYDIAVSYELSWPFNYTADFVKAKKKVLWLHLDYDESGLDYRVDRKNFLKFDKIVAVSRRCLENFVGKHPELNKKCAYMPNLMSQKLVQAAAKEEVQLPFTPEKNEIVFVTVCRIDFPHKGLDRGIEAFKRLKAEGILNHVKWLIVGEGPDSVRLHEMISISGLEKTVYDIGLRENPIPYVARCDVFFLPSRFEGKPMAVTEAQMAGTVPAVTRYASAEEQICNGVDGYIFDNSEEGIYRGLKEIILNPEKYKEMKDAVIKTDYGNESEIKIFDEIVAELQRKQEG